MRRCEEVLGGGDVRSCEEVVSAIHHSSLFHLLDVDM